MARFVGKYANPSYSVGSYAGGRVVQTAIGTIVAPVGVANADVIAICKVPAGAQIISRQVYVDGVLVAAPVIGFTGALTALNLIEGPVTAPVANANLANGSDGDVVIEYTISATEAVAAGDDIFVRIDYIYCQPKP